jgi:hypothetical protein
LVGIPAAAQHVLTQSRSGIDGLNCYWRDVYDECRWFEILNGGGLLTRVPCVDMKDGRARAESNWVHGKAKTRIPRNEPGKVK